MDTRRLLTFTTLLISLVFVQQPMACVYYESVELYRIAMFRAEVSGMAAFRPFYYYSDILNCYIPNPTNNDQQRNAEEWQKVVGKSVTIDDINFILSKTPPQLFLIGYQDKKLGAIFDGNTFINALLAKSNQALLDYLAFAKRNEFYNFMSNESWWTFDNSESESLDLYKNDLFEKGEVALNSATSTFLKQRYAYHKVRLLHQTNQYEECVDLYDKYFGSEITSIVQAWALLHKALSLDNLGQTETANYLYSLIFDYSDSRKTRCFYGFNNSNQILEATLKRAKDNKERIAILALATHKNPGPALAEIKEIYTLAPNSRYLPPLIMREINKLEDWMLTPAFTNYTPSDYYTDYFNYDADYQTIKQENYKKDRLLLVDLISFLTGIYPKSSGELKAFLSVALAHLHVMNEDEKTAAKYLAQVNPDAPKSIIQQLAIENVMVAIQSNKLKDAATLNLIAKSLDNLSELGKQNNEINEIVNSLTTILSVKFLKSKQVAIAGLLKLKSQQIKNQTDVDYFYIYGNYYPAIHFFDFNAVYQDMDTLLGIIHKPNKTVFEKFITDQPLADDNVYKDLKGTLAFRVNNLQVAYQTFSEIPQEFWDTTYAFSEYLNENPFILRLSQKKRDFTYPFSKTLLVEEMIRLTNTKEKDSEKAAENYFKLANAYYNCTVWGNSWMMTVLSQSSSHFESYFPNFDNGIAPNSALHKNKDSYDAYYGCTRAAHFYKKAYESTKNKEKKAFAALMLHICDYNAYINVNFYDDEYLDYQEPKYVISNYLKEFYTTYRTTATFKKYQCPLLDDFAIRMKWL